MIKLSKKPKEREEIPLKGAEFNLETLLAKYSLKDSDKESLRALFDYTSFLLDDDENLTRALNLTSKAKNKLEAQLITVFEGDMTPITEEAKENDKKEVNDCSIFEDFSIRIHRDTGSI